MPNSSSIPWKGSACSFPGGLRLILLLLFLLFSLTFASCSGSSYKSEVADVVDSIMSSLQQGDFGQLNGLKEALGQIETTGGASDPFRNIDSWETKVGKKKNNSVTVNVEMSIQGNTRTFDMVLTNENGEWIPEENITLYQTIDFIPLIKAEK